MAYPKVDRGTKICIEVSKTRGITLYGNTKAMRTLARWLLWISKSNPSDHFECHTFWHLSDNPSNIGKEKNNIWAIFDNDTYAAFDQSKVGFEVTFMAVEDSDLREYAKYKKSKRIPKKSSRHRETK